MHTNGTGTFRLRIGTDERFDIDGDIQRLPPAPLNESPSLPNLVSDFGTGGAVEVTVAGRADLGRVVQLQVSSSALGDQATALRVGKVVAARVLLGGSIVRMGEEAQVSVKVIETETTRVLATVSTIFEAGAKLSALSKELNGKLSGIF